MAIQQITPLQINNPVKFSVYRNAALSSIANFAKVNLDSKLYDTSSNFDATTNFRFTAPYNGFYHFDGGASTGSGSQLWIASLFKNGSEFTRGSKGSGNGSGVGSAVSDTIQLIAGDYIELWVYSSVALAMEVGSVAPHPFLSGYLVSVT